jgi:hypothetical protein
METTKYCVVARDRTAGHYNRIMLTGPLYMRDAVSECETMKSSVYYKKHYKYFKIVKYSYKNEESNFNNKP